MRLGILGTLVLILAVEGAEEKKPSLGQRFARWLWSPGSQQASSGPNQGRGAPQLNNQQDENCLPCDKIPWVPVARALGHVPATYQSHGSKYTFHVPTIGIVPMRQVSNLYGVPKSQYGLPKQEYGTPQTNQEYGPPPKPEYGPPPVKQEFAPHPPKPEYGPPPPKLEYGPPLKSEYGPPHPPPPKQEYGYPSQNYGPPKQEFGSSSNIAKPDFTPPQLKPPSPNFEQPKIPSLSQLHFIAPKPDNRPPFDLGLTKLIYGHPQAEYIPSKPEYGPPKPEYGPPKPEYGPPKPEYGPPKPEYGPPKPEYGPPKSEYGPPKNEYGPAKAPKAEFGPSEYGPPPKLEFGPPKSAYGPPKSEYGPPKPEYGPPNSEPGPPKHFNIPPIKFSYGPNLKGSYRSPAPRFQGAPLTLLTPPKLPFQLKNPPSHHPLPEAMSYQSFHQYLTPPQAPNGPSIKHEHTIIHPQAPGQFNVQQKNHPMIFTISDSSQACNKCPSGPNLAPIPEPHTSGIEDATIEVGNFGDLPLSDSAHEASSSVTTSHSLPITEVSVTKSVPISEYLSSIEFPVQIIQAPLLDIPELPKYVSLGYGDVEDRLRGHYHHESGFRNLRDEGGKILDSDKASSMRQPSLSNANSIHSNHKSGDKPFTPTDFNKNTQTTQNSPGYHYYSGTEEPTSAYPSTPLTPGYHYYSLTEEPVADTTPFFPTTFSLPDSSPTEGPSAKTNAHGPMQYFDVHKNSSLIEQSNTEIRLLYDKNKDSEPQKPVTWTPSSIASSQARPFSTQSTQIDQGVVPYATLQKIDVPVNHQARKVPSDPLKQPDLQAMMVNREIAGTEHHFSFGSEQIEPVDLPRLIDTLPPDVADKLRALVAKHGESELRHIIAQNLQDLLRKEEDSVDIVRLQKNIDNWTAEGFRRAFTNLPQIDSKKIPDEYLTTSMPEYEASGTHLDPVKSKKNATDYVKVIKGWALVETKVMTTTEEIPERQPWEKLEVSISPLTKEKVYVVTPSNSKALSTTVPPDLPNRIARESVVSTKGTVATTTTPTTVSTTARSPRNADNLIDGVTASVRYLGRNGR